MSRLWTGHLLKEKVPAIMASSTLLTTFFAQLTPERVAVDDGMRGRVCCNWSNGENLPSLRPEYILLSSFVGPGISLTGLHNKITILHVAADYHQISCRRLLLLLFQWECVAYIVSLPSLSSFPLVNDAKNRHTADGSSRPALAEGAGQHGLSDAPNLYLWPQQVCR